MQTAFRTVHKTPHRSAAQRMMIEERRSILIVEPNRAQLIETASALRSIGYLVSEASDFNEGNRILSSEPPDLLITGLKLGAYNGLHLVVRAHARHPEMATIVTSDTADPVLEAEARKHNATYLTKPWQNQDFIRAITRSLESGAH
jgi:DNA-binding NtrC family response regulator